METIKGRVFMAASISITLIIVAIIVGTSIYNNSPAVTFEYHEDNGGICIDGLKREDLTELVIPDEINGKPVTRIGGSAFYNCSSLTSVTIPDSVTSIGDNAFCNCSGLTSITIGKGVTSIDDYVFRDCSSLTSITIPDSVTSVGEYAFYGCTGLTSITMPDSVTGIGHCAFPFCYSLTSINFQGTKAQWRKITLGALWKYNSGITQVVCTDGTITLN